MNEKDKKYIQELIESKRQELKNSKKGKEHFLEHDMKINSPESLIKPQLKEIEKLKEEIAYVNYLLDQIEKKH